MARPTVAATVAADPTHAERIPALTAKPLLRPFAALRPAPGFAAEVAAPPYDVVSTEEARDLASGRPLSFLHISKAEIDLAPGTDPYSPAVYAKAAENLACLIRDGVLRRDAKPCYYAYRIRMGAHVQTGIVGGGAVAAYNANRIRRHEFTRPDKEDDRVRQIEATGAQTGPVFTVHRPHPALGRIVERVTAGAPAYAVELGGVAHTLWVIDADADIAAVSGTFDSMDVIYIADGHHRSAAASRVAAARAAKDPGADGNRPYDYFLLVSFPADEVAIFDYNRVVRDLNGLTAEAFLARVGEAFTVAAETGPAKPASAGEFGMYLDGGWYRIAPKAPPGAAASPVGRLDVSVLQDRLLAPVLGIGDPRTDKRIDFVGGIRGLAGLEKRVAGGWAVAFALYPTSIADLMAVADDNQVMPPKSTWFEPKLADGLVSLMLD
ncbi:MAG: DUF1015 family protein [Alphaproteobacteria bacterium]|nr:DUF1015 family protein [Alphaproteobacteria bacterium]